MHTHSCMHEIESESNRQYKSYVKHRKGDKKGVVLQESKERKRALKRKAIREAEMKNLNVVDSSDSNDDDGNEDEVEDEDEEIPAA